MAIAQGARRSEILDTAAAMFATGGFRASLKEIADACGILPGSLYHHFESKEAIVIELVRRYQADLDRVADGALETDASDDDPLQPITVLGTAIAECAIRNRAALLLTYYEPPSGSGRELTELASRTPDAIETAMRELLRRADEHGAMRPGIDLRVLADRICQSMLHIGIGVYHRTRGAAKVPALKCRMLTEGLATKLPSPASLDRSKARRAADAVIDGWDPGAGDVGDRAEFVLAMARAEFGRRGYEATTIRDVAAAAGVSPGAVYRVVESKEELLGSILAPYVTSVSAGWDAVLQSQASPLQKIDALLWLDINVLDRFSEEHKIQSVSLQFAPPTNPDLGLSFPTQLRQTRTLLADAERAGELRLSWPSPDMRARAAFSLIWTPENIIRDLGATAALQFARETLLRGAAVRSR